MTVPTSVAAWCNPGRANNGSYYWVSRGQTPGVTPTFVQSYIKAYSAWVVSGFSYAWSMLSGPSNYQWAQIGNYQSNGNFRSALQYANGTAASVVQFDFAAPPIPSALENSVSYSTTTHKFVFIRNATGFYTTPALSWTPTTAFISTEITTLANQMMGGYNNHEQFTQNHITYGGVFRDFAGTVISYNTTYFGQSGTAPNFDAWDKACSQ